MLKNYLKKNKIIHFLFEIVIIVIIFLQLPLNLKAIFIILELNIIIVRFKKSFFSFFFYELNFFSLIDSFSFYHSNPKTQCTSSDVVEFIENIIKHSKSGQFMFFIRSNIPGVIQLRKKIQLKFLIFLF
jgi:hypothetical protein